MIRAIENLKYAGNKFVIAVLDGLTAMVRRANKALDAHTQRKAEDLRNFDRGYNWAMSELRTGASTCQQLYDNTDISQTMYTYNKFDAGIRKACYDWEESLANGGHRE